MSGAGTQPAARKAGLFRTDELTLMRRSPTPSLIVDRYAVRSWYITKLAAIRGCNAEELRSLLFVLEERHGGVLPAHCSGAVGWFRPAERRGCQGIAGNVKWSGSRGVEVRVEDPGVTWRNRPATMQAKTPTSDFIDDARRASAARPHPTALTQDESHRLPRFRLRLRCPSACAQGREASAEARLPKSYRPRKPRKDKAELAVGETAAEKRWGRFWRAAGKEGTHKRRSFRY